jgi:hypothetical protein
VQIVLAGASGFLGQAWTHALKGQGHTVVRLVRREPTSPDEVRWDPAQGRIDQAVVDSADVVANLAGAPLVHFPWSESYRREFVASRVDTTRTLAEAIARSERKPAFLAQSGIAGYGDRGDEVITEETPVDATTFMADVVRQWEDATTPASSAGARVVLMRTGVVLDRRGGALRAMLLPFRLGMGGPIGSGEQYFATITLHDWLGAASYLALNEELSGPFNLSGPDPSTNAEFTRELGRLLGRPTVLKVPAFPVRRMAGPMGGEMLASQRVEPRRLLDAGYAFAHNDVVDRLTAALR